MSDRAYRAALRRYRLGEISSADLAREAERAGFGPTTPCVRPGVPCFRCWRIAVAVDIYTMPWICETCRLWRWKLREPEFAGWSSRNGREPAGWDPRTGDWIYAPQR